MLLPHLLVLLDLQQMIPPLKRWWLYLTKFFPCALLPFLLVKGAPIGPALPVANRVLNTHHARFVAQENTRPMLTVDYTDCVSTVTALAI